MTQTSTPALKEGEDYYLNEEGLMVLTEKYHLRRGFCCKSACRHCPYGFNEATDPTIPAELSSGWGNEEEEIEIYQGEIDED